MLPSLLLFAALLFPAPARGYQLHGPYHRPDAAVNNGTATWYCYPTHYATYTGSSYAPSCTFHYFMLLEQSEPDPSDYVLQGQLTTTYNGIDVWTGPTYQPEKIPA